MDKRTLILQLPLTDRVRLHLRAVGRMIPPLAGGHVLAMFIPALVYLLRSPLGWSEARIDSSDMLQGLLIMPMLFMFFSLSISLVRAGELDVAQPNWSQVFTGSGLITPLCALILFLSAPPHSNREIQGLYAAAYSAESTLTRDGMQGAPTASAKPWLGTAAKTSLLIARDELSRQSAGAYTDNLHALTWRLVFPISLFAPLLILLQALARFQKHTASFGQGPARLLPMLTLPLMALASMLSDWRNRFMERLAEHAIDDDGEWSEAEHRSLSRTTKAGRKDKRTNPRL